MVGGKRPEGRGATATSGTKRYWRGGELTLALDEGRIELELERGRHTDVLPELTSLTTAHPLSERLCGLHMLALYRDGRRTEALAVYDGLRRRLAHELGVEPGSTLTGLRRRIERSDPALAQPPTAAGAAPTRPAQLPAAVADFTGRSDFMAELSARVATRGPAATVLTVTGTGGIGKTALAVHVAHAVRHRFPDGQLYADLRGAGLSPAEPEAVLGGFLRALGTPDSAIPDGPAERAALYRSVLDGRRVLILLDNARDAAQIRTLLPGGSGCVALVTSRARMTGLTGSHVVDLEVMDPEEAFTLFARIVGEERAEVEREAAMEVLAACGYLPLAIRIAASRLAARRTWSVSVLARKLADGRRRLDELRAGDLAVKATFELGYGQLEPAQARAFRLLGLAEGPEVSLTAAAAVLDLPPEETERILTSLEDISLLESTAPGRYRFHDLVRLYARVCAEREAQSPDEQDAALSRLLDFYLATAARVYALERPGDRTVAHFEPTRAPGLHFASSRTGLDWLFNEADGLITCVRRCTGPGTRRRAADLLMAALDLAESGARPRQYESAALAVSEAAHAAEDPRTEARARSALGHLYGFTGRFDLAAQELRRALALAADDPLVASRAANQLGIVAGGQGRREDAERFLGQALAAFRADGNEAGEASALSNLSRLHVDLGRTQSGVDLAEQGLAIYRRLGAPLRLANGMYTLGIALTRAQRLDEALIHLTRALGLFRDARQTLWEGMTHFRLAEIHLAAHRPAKALAHAERSLALGGLGGEWRRFSFLTVRAKALMALGQATRAQECWQEAREIRERLGPPEPDEVRRLLSDARWPLPPGLDSLPGHTSMPRPSDPLSERRPPS
ncbi:tetratricopeptide repeat protein [Streptomyces sp. NA02950]|uniref:ATP-binding protein n=1 Tax=Streptomyces sp. NA02950 TaxID=2742137 RepID=UPI0015922B6A|nr:BTAD domain-containing putative transcriptional regulator [Streptomyces sp. NA02950]QKV93147.1 tetratricopeptide repeat protein [Streptomyces sp. NA02950]